MCRVISPGRPSYEYKTCSVRTFPACDVRRTPGGNVRPGELRHPCQRRRRRLDYIQNLINSNSLPNFKRFQTQGAWTNNARCDYDVSVTLPNHTTQVTGRGVMGTTGHNWTSNSDPAVGQTIQSNKGSYVAGVFDVAHDNGLRTAMYATKTKFSLFDTSYNATNGHHGINNGRDKLDTYVYNGSSSALTSSVVSAMNSNPYNYTFVHYTDPDSAGHGYGWGSTNYNNSLVAVDGYLGSLFNMVTSNPTLNGHTAIVLTADHGGSGYDHSNATLALDYTIPFYVWGPAWQPRADLYSPQPGHAARPADRPAELPGRGPADPQWRRGQPGVAVARPGSDPRFNDQLPAESGRP